MCYSCGLADAAERDYPPKTRRAAQILISAPCYATPRLLVEWRQWRLSAPRSIFSSSGHEVSLGRRASWPLLGAASIRRISLACSRQPPADWRTGEQVSRCHWAGLLHNRPNDKSPLNDVDGPPRSSFVPFVAGAGCASGRECRSASSLQPRGARRGLLAINKSNKPGEPPVPIRLLRACESSE